MWVTPYEVRKQWSCWCQSPRAQPSHGAARPPPALPPLASRTDLGAGPVPHRRFLSGMGPFGQVCALGEDKKET